MGPPHHFQGTRGMLKRICNLVFFFLAIPTWVVSIFIIGCLMFCGIRGKIKLIKRWGFCCGCFLFYDHLVLLDIAFSGITINWFSVFGCVCLLRLCCISSIRIKEQTNFVITWRVCIRTLHLVGYQKQAIKFNVTVTKIRFRLIIIILSPTVFFQVEVSRLTQEVERLQRQVSLLKIITFWCVF